MEPATLLTEVACTGACVLCALRFRRAARRVWVNSAPTTRQRRRIALAVSFFWVMAGIGIIGIVALVGHGWLS